MVCFVIGFIQLLLPNPVSSRQTYHFPRAAPQPPARDIDIDPSLRDWQTGGTQTMADPQKLAWIQLDRPVRVRHPVSGETTARVTLKIIFSELWQKTRGPQVPWEPTGNVYVGARLENGLFVLNWQNRFYALDQMIELSDNDIQRDFAPHARKFAQSDQTAVVYFDYPPAVWRIDDIGKFQISWVGGSGLRLASGSSGRFIHASGDSRRALVVEDYEGAGGQDKVWIGYQIDETDIQAA
jgi:hypothetical protein